jgi:predicted Zn-dependent protease
MRFSLLTLSCTIFAFAAPLWPADSTFRHPQGFTVFVPDGWKAESQAACVVVSKGIANVDVFAFSGNGSPEGLLRTITPQIIQQWRSANKLKQTSCTIASIEGMCAWFSGVNPKGQAMNLKMVALTQPGKGYMLFVETPQQNTSASALNADISRIEQSFSPTAAPTPDTAHPAHPVDAQKPGALEKAYEGGQISTEEYERQKRQLQGHAISNAQDS